MTKKQLLIEYFTDIIRRTWGMRDDDLIDVQKNSRDAAIKCAE